MAKSKQNEAKNNVEPKTYELYTYKSNANGVWNVEEYETLAEAQTAMRTDYEAEIQNCIEHGQQPASAHIEDKEAYIIGIRKCQWEIKEL